MPDDKTIEPAWATGLATNHLKRTDLIRIAVNRCPQAADSHRAYLATCRLENFGQIANEWIQFVIFCRLALGSC